MTSATGMSLKIKGENSEDQLSAALLGAQFCETTTSHGVSHIYNAKGLCRRMFWILLSLASLGALTYHLYRTIGGFIKYDKTTNIDKTRAYRLNFPAVTICNNNMIRKLYQEKNSEFADLINQTNGDNRDAIKEWVYTTFSEYDNDDVVREIGHDIGDLLILCNFNGYDCYTDHFTDSWNVELGNCYTFNIHGGNNTDLLSGNDTKLVTRRAGRKYGLMLELNIEQYNYIPSLTEASGARILIHHPEEMPFPEEDGVSVGPNTLVNIAVREVNYERLTTPYNNCTNADDTDIQNVYADEYPGIIKYSLQACLKTCLQDAIIKECGCYLADIPYLQSTFANLDIPSGPCAGGLNNWDSCQTGIWYKFTEGQVTCKGCYDACRETKYETTATTTVWPAPSFIDTYLSYVQESHPQVTEILNETYAEDADIARAVKENFLKVNIYFESMTTIKSEETPKVEDFQFVSDLGGALGLWAGWSALTIFEMIEALVNVLTYLCMSKCGSRKSGGSDSSKVASFG